MSGTPAIEEGVVASAYNTALYTGFPVKKVDTGAFELAAAGDSIYGIISEITQFYLPALSRTIKPLGSHPKLLPANTTYTGTENESRISVIPVKGNLFVMDGDAALTTGTRAGARALIGSNGNHVISSDDAAMDVSDLETNDGSAASAQWTVIDVIEEFDTDFTASRIKFICECNEPQFPESGTGL